MSKIKIKELSEKMSLDVKDILAKCKELSIVARTQSSSISSEDAKKIQISLVGEPILKKPKTDNEIIKRSGSKVTIRRKKRPEPIKKESSKEEEKKVESQDKRDLKPTNDLKNQINNQNINNDNKIEPKKSSQSSRKIVRTVEENKDDFKKNKSNNKFKDKSNSNQDKKQQVAPPPIINKPID